MSELAAAAQALLGADVEPLSGGYSGETFLVRTSAEAAGLDGGEAVLRLYLREPERAAIDAALHRLVRGLLPVPRILDARYGSGSGEAPSYLLFERLPGVRLDLLLADSAIDADRRRAMGEQVGLLLARLSGMPFLQAGLFTGPDLAVSTFDPGGLEQWVQAHRERGHLAEWPGADLDRLIAVATDAQALLDTGERVCLCHSDLNPKNLLVDPDTGLITGLLDWEYAHAGAPHTDLGNLLRFETDEAFCGAVVRSYAWHAPRVGSAQEYARDSVERGRAHDLLALVDLAARPQPNAMTLRADDLLRKIARSGELAGGRPSWV